MKSRTILGTIALVTAANRGIGRAITEALLQRGAKKVYAAARDPDKLESLEKLYGGRVVRVQLDVTDEAQVAAVTKRATDLDLLFNNAGVFQAANLFAETIVEQARAAARS